MLGVQHLRNHADGDRVDSLSFEVLSETPGSFVRVLRRHKKADLSDRLNCLILIRKYGRDGVIRTLDP